jgi:flagellar hook protein FlgE
MSPVGNSTFQPTADSGPIVLKQVGENGIGSYIPSSIELSNIDNNAEMVALIEEANRISYLHSAQNTVNQVQQQLASN